MTRFSLRVARLLPTINSTADAGELPVLAKTFGAQKSAPRTGIREAERAARLLQSNHHVLVLSVRNADTQRTIVAV